MEFEEDFLKILSKLTTLSGISENDGILDKIGAPCLDGVTGVSSKLTFLLLAYWHLFSLSNFFMLFVRNWVITSYNESIIVSHFNLLYLFMMDKINKLKFYFTKIIINDFIFEN